MPTTLLHLPRVGEGRAAPPDLSALVAALHGRSTAEAAETWTMPCPVQDPLVPPQMTGDRQQFRCDCGCGARGDVFDFWVRSLGLPADAAARERQRFAWQVVRAADLPAATEAVEDPARRELLQRTLRG